MTSAAAVYLTALPNDFVSDARGLIVDNPALLRSDEWLAWFGRYYFWGSYVVGHLLYRPLTILSYVATLRVFGAGPLAFVAGNVVLHAVASGLVLALGRRLVGAPAAWMGALLFAVHPLHTEAVAWIGGRPDVLAAVLALGSALCFLRATEAGAGRPGLLAALTVVLLFAALLSKEHVITLPVWFIAVALLERERRSTRWAALTLAGSLVAVVVFLGMRFVAVPPARGLFAFYVQGLGSPWQAWRWLAGVAVAGRYAALFAWPRALTFDHSSVTLAWAAARRVPLPDALLGVAAVAAFVAAFVWAVRRDRGLALALALVPTTYALISGFPYTPQLIVAERFTYLPSAGACLALGWVLARLGQLLAGPAVDSSRGEAAESVIPRRALAGAPGRIVAIVFVAAVVALAVRTAVRNPDWRTEATVTAAALAVEPESPLGLRIRGHEEYRRGHLEPARALLEQSLRLNPWRSEPYVVLADIYLKEGKKDALLALALQAEVRLPDRRELLHLGGLLWQVGHRQEAERLVMRVVMTHPGFVHARLALGGLMMERGRPEQALEQFRAASALEPENRLAWLGMAQASAALGWTEQAGVYAERARRAGGP